jgi:hypothetical protein
MIFLKRLIKNKDKIQTNNFDFKNIATNNNNAGSGTNNNIASVSLLKIQNTNPLIMNNYDAKINSSNLDMKSQFLEFKGNYEIKKEENFDRKPIFSKEKYSDNFLLLHKNENKQEFTEKSNENFGFRFNYNL